MNRIGIAVSLALIVGVHGALAGDGAALNVLGFSPDGRYFAFEQYGEQDGAGSLYSTIAAIEVTGDRLVKGMPVSVVMDPDNPNLGKEPADKQLAAIRAQAAAGAEPLLKKLGISARGQMIASSPASKARSILHPEQVKAARQAVVHTIALPPERFGQGARLTLREFDIPLPRCKDLVIKEHPNGFELTLERKGRPTIHLSRDQAIPESRHCPDHYGIAEVHALPLPDGLTALAVAIEYFYMAYHGPDRRFIVVTGRVN